MESDQNPRSLAHAFTSPMHMLNIICHVGVTFFLPHIPNKFLTQMTEHRGIQRTTGLA